MKIRVIGLPRLLASHPTRPRIGRGVVAALLLLLTLWPIVTRAQTAPAPTAPAMAAPPQVAAAPKSSAIPEVSTAYVPNPAKPDEAVNTGDNAWMLTSSAFVMLMVPGLALYYAGMVRRKNVLGTMMHAMAALGIIGVEWVVIGYAMAFGKSQHGLIGWDPALLFLNGIRPEHVHNQTHTSELVYVMFQGMFAAITPALICGAFAERVKFSAYCWFVLLWGLLIYNPLAHWVWGGGWLGSPPIANAPGVYVGAIDFAGGTVVHISAGFSALVTALYLGKRVGYPHHVLQPNSLVLTLLGAGLLWFGWFGFNGGSAVGSAAGAFGSAGVAFAATQIAAAAGGMSWMIAEWMKHRRPTSLGFASGLVAGLVAITPASGFVSPAAAIVIGALAGLVCFGAVLLKAKFGYDDALDAFGVHGVGGFLGALLTGIFCQTAFNNKGPDGLLSGNPSQLLHQLIAASSAAAIAALGTFILVVVIDNTIGFRVARDIEIEGTDSGIHGEQGWMLESLPAPTIELAGSVSTGSTRRSADGASDG